MGSPCFGPMSIPGLSWGHAEPPSQRWQGPACGGHGPEAESTRPPATTLTSSFFVVRASAVKHLTFQNEEVPGRAPAEHGQRVRGTVWEQRQAGQLLLGSTCHPLCFRSSFLPFL